MDFYKVVMLLLSYCNYFTPAMAEDQSVSYIAKSIDIIKQKSRSILMRWDMEPEMMYMVQATYGYLVLTSCDNGIMLTNSTFLFTSTSDGKAFHPRTYYNLALCKVDRNPEMNLPLQQNVSTGPPAPTDIRLSGEEQSSLTLTWDDNDANNELPVTKYGIRIRKTEGGGEESAHFVEARGQKRFVIPNLTSNSHYSVTVTSVTNDVTTFSDESESASRPTAPGKVSDLLVTFDPFTSRLVVEWKKPVGGDAIVGYSVIWKREGTVDKFGSSDLILHDPNQASYCYITSPVQENSNYDVTVTTSNEGGNSETTATIQAYVLSTHPRGITLEMQCSVFTTASNYETTTFNNILASETYPDTSILSTDSTATTDETQSSSDSSTTGLHGQTTAIDLSDSTTFVTTSCNQSPQLTEPAEPIFNVTSTLTSIRVEWLVVDDVDYYVIESDPLHFFATVHVNASATNHIIYDVTPYTRYTVLMYSVITSNTNEDIRSTASPIRCKTFNKVVCPESTVPYLHDDVNVTFPTTHAGYTNSSMERCSAESDLVGGVLGTRACSLDGEWLEPNWLSSCNVSLQILASINITNHDERYQVASDLVLLTSLASAFSSQDLHESVSIVEKIVSIDELEQNTSSLTVKSIGNILSIPEEQLQANYITKRLLKSLDEVASKVKVQRDEEYQSVTSNLALAVAMSNPGKTEKIGFLQRSNPLTEEYGFSTGQFRMFFGNQTDCANCSHIVVPEEAVAFSKTGRISFYAFSDSNAFQISNGNLPDYSNIPLDAKVHSETVLSASIVGNVVTNLNDNVTMMFKTNQLNCVPVNGVNCGQQFCGFWNESSLSWSDVGCTSTYITEEVIECQCNHLTNFAALFAHGDSEGVRDNFTLDIITLVGCGVSLLAIVLTIVAISVAWQSGKLTIQKRTLFLMLNLSLALFLLYGFLILSFLDAITNNDNACTAVAVILHFALLSSLTWMMAEAIYVYIGIAKPLYFRSELSNERVWLHSALLGWGFPAVFVALSAGCSIISYGNALDDSTKTCWISPDMMLYLIIIPASIVLTVNVMIYCTIVHTFVTRKFGKSGSIISGKNIVFSVTLFLVFGITWVFGFLIFGSSDGSLVMAYIFAITTSLQGFFLFILFVVRNKEIRMSVAHEVQSFHSKIFYSDRLSGGSSDVDSSTVAPKSGSGKWCSQENDSVTK